MYFVSLAVFIIGGCDDFYVVEIAHVRNHLMLTHVFIYAQMWLSNINILCVSQCVFYFLALSQQIQPCSYFYIMKIQGFPGTFNMGE